jgi:hypothetical protein
MLTPIKIIDRSDPENETITEIAVNPDKVVLVRPLGEQQEDTEIIMEGNTPIRTGSPYKEIVPALTGHQAGARGWRAIR